MLPSPAQAPLEVSAVVGIRSLVAKQRIRCLFLLAFLLSANAAAQTFEELSAQASAAREQGNPLRAVELYNQAVQLNPKSPEAWWFLGSLQYQVGDYAPATAALSHYLELQPDAAPALALRGLCEFETGDYQQALTDIQKGISRGAANDPRHEQILHYHEGLLLTRLGRFDDALRSYQVFADKKISSFELMLAIGLAGLRMPMLPAQLKADQQDLVGSTGAAGYQFMSGDTKAAQQGFGALFQRFPTQPNLHYFYGYMLYAREPDSALAEFQNELRVAPENLDALIMASWVLLMENQPAQALPFARRAVQQKSDYVTAQLVLGRSLMETGNIQEGVEHLEQGLKSQPDDLETHIALATAYSKLGRNEEARKERMLCLQLTENGLTQNGGTQVANP